MAGTIRPRERAAAICSTCICRMTRYCAVGHTLPVYIDIHGGGFTYGYKELNRNFNVHLAEQGFAVFSLNYRPAPQTDLRGQLADIQAALRWIAAIWPIIRSIRTRCSSPAIPQVAR